MDADEDQTSTGDELTDFARSFAEDTPPAAGGETPSAEETKPAEEVKPPSEEKSKEEVKSAAEADEEDIFKLDEEKPKEEKPDEEEKEPEKPETSDDWKRLRESRNKYKQEAADRESILREKEAEVAELKTKAAEITELREKVKLFEEQEKELALARVEATLEFKQSIQAPLDVIRDEAKALSEENDTEFTAIKEMLLESDRSEQRKKLKELTAGWDEVDRQELKTMADDARVLLDKQEAMRANAHATVKEQKDIASLREQEARETSRKEFAKVTGDVVKSLREKLPFVPLLEGETEDDRYSNLKGKVERVDFDTQTPQAKAYAAASALALPQLIKTVAAKDAEIADLKEALTKATSGKPSVTLKSETTDSDEGKDFFTEFGITDPTKRFANYGD